MDQVKFGMDTFFSIAVALSATLFCIWLLRPIALRIGLVDRPGGRKLHAKESPVIGGLAMFFGFAFSLLTLPISLQSYRGLIGGSALLLLIGVADDFREINYKARLISQFVASLLLVFWGHETIKQLGDLFFFGNLKLGLFGIPLTILMTMGYINAMNMMDGQDGLAGGIALGQALLLMILSIQLDRWNDFKLLTILITLLLAFLSFNINFSWRKKANIFMGDAGITFIAFLLAWLGIDISQANSTLVKPMTLLWIFALPLFDFIHVIFYRLQQGKSPITPGRDHIHHILHNTGFNIKNSAIFLCVLSFSLGLIGLLLNELKLKDGWQLIGFMITLMGYFLFVRMRRTKLLSAEENS
jgi:UDP-GlcNAc:undecaprenyl-phosphate/decaprenyl-phosphate GlcNAc-1-phosphate transferase